MHRTAVALLILSGTLAPSGADAQWTSQTSGTTAELRGLSVVDRRVAWVSGTQGRFARTTDGGATWRVDSIACASRDGMSGRW